MAGQRFKYKKFLSRHWTGSRSRKKRDKAVSFRKRFRKNTRAVSVGSRARLSSVPSLRMENRAGIRAPPRYPVCCRQSWINPRVETHCHSLLLHSPSPRFFRSSKIKTIPNTKLVLVGREPLRYLEFNKSYRQNVFEVDLFQKIQLFPVSK